MQRTTIIGMAGALTLSVLAGGVGMALAHEAETGHHGTGQDMMAMKAMDPASMESHMREVLGDDAYAMMIAAMPAGMHESMMDAMASACADQHGS